MQRSSLLLIVMLLALSSVAQPKQNTSGDQNYFKINLFSLGVRNLSIQYERAIEEHTSFCLGFRIMPSGHVPFAGTVRDKYLKEVNDENRAAANDFVKHAQASDWAIVPEFRYYFGKGSHRGFYIAPFARIGGFHFHWNYTFVDNDSAAAKHPTDMDANLSLFGGGVMLGTQYHFGHFLIDWWIMGAAYNSAHLTFEGKGDFSDQTSLEEQNTQTDIENIHISGYGVDATVDDNGARGSGSGGVPTLRFGFCVGYGF